MTTVPLPGFLPADALDEFEQFDGPLVYLAAPLGHQVYRVNHFCRMRQ